jgi:hypothetical protein
MYFGHSDALYLLQRKFETPLPAGRNTSLDEPMNNGCGYNNAQLITHPRLKLINIGAQ